MNKLLVIDVDDLALASSITSQMLWKILSFNWKKIFQLINYSFKTKIKKEEFLLDNLIAESKLVLFNEEVISYIKEFREKGGQTIVFSKKNHLIAKKIISELGIFDYFKKLNANQDLISQKKLFLEKHFRPYQFEIISSTFSKIMTLPEFSKAILINPSKKLILKISKMGLSFKPLGNYENIFFSLIKALRPNHWVKNFLVFVPLIIMQQFHNEIILNALIAFASFCMISSSAYLINDVLDLESDSLHPHKKFRPLASGKITIQLSFFSSIFLLLTSLFLASKISTILLFLMIGYFLTSTSYTFVFKKYAILDICILALLYSFRIIAGGLATGIQISFWLLAFSIFIFLSLASVKRNSELFQMRKNSLLNSSRRGYEVNDLSIISSISLNSGFIAILVLAFYINSDSVKNIYLNPEYLWGICFVILYWTLRIIFITNRGNMHSDPIVFAMKDNTSRLCFLLIIITLFLSSN